MYITTNFSVKDHRKNKLALDLHAKTALHNLQDVVFALAHATGKIGRFTLIERWRSNERLLAPNENPLKVSTS